MYSYYVDSENILRIFKDGVEIASYGPWEDRDRADSWGKKRVEYLEENGDLDQVNDQESD